MAKSEESKKPKIVVIGGGTGTFTVLSGLRKYSADLAAVITMADNGGSAGVLREEFGILPPGDVRRALIALAHSDQRMLAELFNYRFEEGGLRGHAFGNIMLTALERLTGSFEEALNEAGKILGVQGQVLPITLDNVQLYAKLENGSLICGETNIDVPKHDGSLKIKQVFLDPPARINERAQKALLAADMIVLSPGGLYYSIIPNLLVKGTIEAIRKSKAKKVYVANIMTKWGDTHSYKASDFINAVEKYLGRGVLDYAIINTKHPSPERLKNYEKESAEFVQAAGLAKKPIPILGDFLRHRGFVRHDPDKLAKVLISLI